MSIIGMNPMVTFSRIVSYLWQNYINLDQEGPDVHTKCTFHLNRPKTVPLLYIGQFERSLINKEAIICYACGFVNFPSD